MRSPLGLVRCGAQKDRPLGSPFGMIQFHPANTSNDTSRIGEHRLPELEDWCSPTASNKDSGLWPWMAPLFTNMRVRCGETHERATHQDAPFPLPPLRSPKHVFERHAQFDRERRQGEHRRVVRTPLQAPDYIGMYARKAGQCFSAQFLTSAQFPDLLSQTPQYRS